MTPTDQKQGTGVPGLDEVLGGGLPRNCLYLIEGNPGVGKTTLAMQFLLEGRARGERGLYVTLSESRLELEAVARSHNWSLEDISIIELSAVHSAEVELTQLTKLLMSEAEPEPAPNGKIRLIALTGYGQAADRERAVNAGFDAHLLKPVAWK